MMASNIATAEAGGYQEQPPPDNWWLPKWSSWLATIGAVFVGFFGAIGMVFNIFSFLPPSPLSIIACGLQVVAAAIILAIEGSSIVSFLTFAKPIGLIFEGKPLYVKTAVFAALTVIPMLLNPNGFAAFMAFLISLSITCMYGMILVGKKGNLDDMRAAATQPKI